MLMAGQKHPPFLFWSCQKRNGPCTVQREKTLRRVGLRRRRPPAAGGGWLALPCRSQGRKRPTLGETSSPGQSGIPSATLPAAAHASSKNSQRQRKEKQLNASTTPTQEHHPPRDGSRGNRRRPKRARRSAQIGACTDTPTPVARGGPLHRSAHKRLFLFHRARRILFLGKTKKRMGGASPVETAPGGRSPHLTPCISPLFFK